MTHYKKNSVLRKLILETHPHVILSRTLNLYLFEAKNSTPEMLYTDDWLNQSVVKDSFFQMD